MYISDEELLMLEHLTYLNEDVAKAAGIDKFELNKGDSIYSTLDPVDTKYTITSDIINSSDSILEPVDTKLKI